MINWEKLKEEIQLTIVAYRDLLSVPKHSHKTISCALNKELYQLVSHYSANLGVSTSMFIKLAIINFLEQLGAIGKKDAKLKLRKIVEEIVDEYLSKKKKLLKNEQLLECE